MFLLLLACTDADKSADDSTPSTVHSETTGDSEPACVDETCNELQDTCEFALQPKLESVLVTAGAPRVPARVVEQVRVGGRVVIPVGDESTQVLLRLTRTPDAEDGTVQWREERFENCRFVPLIGRYGWKET